MLSTDLLPVPIFVRSRAFLWHFSPATNQLIAPASNQLSAEQGSTARKILYAEADTPLMVSGIKSQQAVRLAARLQEATGVPLSATLVFDHPTPRSIAAHLASLPEVTTFGAATAVTELATEIMAGNSAYGVPASFDARIGLPMAPVSTMQEQMLLHQQLQPDSAIYNMSFRVVLATHCPTFVAQACLHALVQRHSVLRTHYSMGSAGFAQVVLPENGFFMPLRSIAADPTTMAASVSEPFDLFSTPPVRADLCGEPERAATIQVTMHHVMCDAVTIGLLHAELLANCNSMLANELPPSRPPLPFQYADFAAWQRDRYLSQLQSGEIASEGMWWREKLAGAPSELRVPWKMESYAPSDEATSDKVAVVPVHIDADTVYQLLATCRTSEASPLCGLLCIWSALLLRLCGQTELILGQPYSLRDSVGAESLAGTFINFLPLRLKQAVGTTFQTAMQDATVSMAEALAHGDIPVQDIVGELARSSAGTASSSTGVALYQTMLQLLDHSTDLDDLLLSNTATRIPAESDLAGLKMRMVSPRHF